MKLVNLKDIVTLYETSPNKYGDMEIVEEHRCNALFTFGISQENTGFEEQIQTQAHTYLDPEDSWVLQRCMRLEGYYLSITRYGQEEWFIIRTVVLGEEKLTSNQINNIHVTLSKVEPL